MLILLITLTTKQRGRYERLDLDEVFIGVFVLAFVSACTKPVAKCTDPTDNPSHHYLMGMQALEEKKN